MLRQALQNLVGNSIKYCGDEAPLILISPSVEAGQYVVSIKDNGTGFPMDQRELVFEPFYRVYQSRKRRGSGIHLHGFTKRCHFLPKISRKWGMTYPLTILIMLVLY